MHTPPTMSIDRRRRFLCPLLASAALLAAFAAAPAAAQAPVPDPWQSQLSRTRLAELLLVYDSAAASPAFSDATRTQARREGALIRGRLSEGDFQVGDQIALVVEGEEALTGTFVVQPGPLLILPELGEIPLRGVLRSELQEHLQTELARYLRSPVVHARASIRVLVTGAVGRAGYHVLSTETLLADALMAAGGPTAGAQVDRLRIERAGTTIWDGELLQQAILEGRTLDQMSLRAGDRIDLPAQRGETGPIAVVRTALVIILPIIGTAVSLLQVF